VVANQSVFFHSSIQGSIVAIYSPFYVGTVDTVGYHMHFISDDRGKGGHVLDLNLSTAEIGLDKKNELRLVEPMLPQAA
jgi:acetolactate decarboxylase